MLFAVVYLQFRHCNSLFLMASSIEKDLHELTLENHLCHLPNAAKYLSLELHESVSCNDIAMTQNLVNVNYDVNTRDSTGSTPLMIAVINRNEKIIQILLDAGADVTIVNSENKSALQIFCAIQYFTSITQQLFFYELRNKFATSEETAKCLINSGCRLYQAAYFCDAKIIELMLKQGYTDHSMHPIDKTTALHVAVLFKSVDSVKLLLKYAGNIFNIINLSEHVSSSDKENLQKEAESVVVTYLLQSDAREVSKLYQFWRIYGNEKLMQILLKRHYYYYVNAQDNTGNNALMMALITKEQTIIKILLAAGADITMLNYYNKSVLDIVLAGHHLETENRKLILEEFHKKFHTSEEVAQRLIDAGSDLYQAAYLNDAKIIQYMLEREFSANSKHPETGESPLHSAALRGNLDSVKLLLKYGADVNAQSIQGATPLFYLWQLCTEHDWKEVEVLKMFLNSGSLATSCTSLGTFQISPVLKKGSCELIRVVLHSNIDFAAKDQNLKMNVLDYLVMNKNPEFEKHFEYQWSEQRDKCVELLLHHNANPQFIVTGETNNEQITIFDAAEKTNHFDKLKPVIAHLAVLEGLGVSITETTCTKLNSHPSLKKYFNKCQKLMRKNICESVTFF